jgi:hypothetical protein
MLFRIMQSSPQSILENTYNLKKKAMFIRNPSSPFPPSPTHVILPKLILLLLQDPSPDLENHLEVLSSSGFAYSEHYIQMESFNMWSL